MANKTGVIYLKIGVYLNQDVSRAKAEKFVQETDYNIPDAAGVSVDHTEIKEWGTSFDEV